MHRTIFAGLLIFAVLSAGCQRTQSVSTNPLAPTLKSQSCQVWDDPQGVVHVRGGNELGALACAGFVHSRDRAWQMDHFRRVFQGRQAAVYGRALIEADFRMRMLGLEERARSLFDSMDESLKRKLWAYSFGVNQGFAHAIKAGVYEFQEVGIRPEPWQPWDSVGLVLLQSLDQTRKGFEQELRESEWKKLHGEPVGDLFSEDGLPWDTAVLKDKEFRTGGDSKAGSSHSKGSSDGTGSNNWVVSSEVSKSGNAWLANDPHLTLVHPPFWHWIHIEGGDLDIIGASLPGLPAVVSGSNRKVAWGLTNSYLDAGDIVSVPRKDLKGTTTFRPVIWFKLGALRLPFLFKSYRRTQEGWPVLPLEAEDGRAYVLRWSGFDTRPADFGALFGLMTAESVQGFDRSLAEIGIPSWNFVYADTRGKIGFRVSGRIPKRTAAPAFGIPQVSLDSLRAWKFLDSSEMPHVSSPARHWIATANNRHWPRSASLHGGRAYAEGFRAFRIEELLSSERNHDLESMRRIQCDVQAVDARFLLPLMINRIYAGNSEGWLPGEMEIHSLELLKRWDYQTPITCLACPIYRRWTDLLLTRLEVNEAALFRMLRAGSSELQDALVATFRDAIGSMPLQPWGNVHLIRFPHLAPVALKSFSETQWVPTPGDEHSVSPGVMKWHEKGFYEHTVGASHRLIVELSTPPKVYAILAGPNQDVRDRKMDSHQEIWRRWAECKEPERRNFPVDWSQGAAKTGAQVLRLDQPSL